MTKINTKLLVFLSLFVCSLCLCFGLAACNSDSNNDNNTNDPVDSGGEHTHTFGGFWLFDGEDGHYQLATCHPAVKSELQPHVDENGDLICDVCDYVMHVHVDEDEDNICDECQTVLHKHTYKDEWTFSENNHWHEATCEHFIERSDYVAHSFVNGVCVCGVKESEVKVYNLYKNSPEYELFFTQWLDWLESEGITVEYTESGDGVYHYGDGHSEVHFLGARTVKVKAAVNGEPLAHVWIMISLYDSNNEGYVQVDGTIALGIAETDANGIAEITFRPIGGYSSATMQYRIRIAEKKDIAYLQGVAEEDASRPIPNRYEVDSGNDGFEYLPYEVSEDSNSEDIAATIEFVLSAGWNANEKFELPYHRFFEDLVNGEGIEEEGFTYEFITSGGDFFDYFTFSPAKYSLAGSSSAVENDKIVDNAKLAASGIYKISFTVEGNATAQLYYWNENGVNLGAYHITNPDGTPSSMYLTSQSGGTAGTGKYTGGNFVEVKISPSLGLRLYQLGIKTDVECKVTITVERTDDFGVGPDAIFEWNDEEGKSVINIEIPQDDILVFGLQDVPAGLYALSVGKSTSISGPQRYYAYTDIDERKVCLWVANEINGVRGQYKGIIRITEETKYIYLENTLEAFPTTMITLEPYELPTVKANEYTVLPVTTTAMKESYVMPLDAPVGTYTLKVRTGGVNNGGANYPLTICIGDKEYLLNEPSVYVTQGTPFYTYTGSVEVGEQDKTISIKCSSPYALSVGIELNSITD